MPEKEASLLAILEICVDKIITLYHSSLFAGHQGMIKTYLMIGDTQYYALFVISHKRMPHMSTSEKGQTTDKAVTG